MGRSCDSWQFVRRLSILCSSFYGASDNIQRAHMNPATFAWIFTYLSCKKLQENDHSNDNTPQGMPSIKSTCVHIHKHMRLHTVSHFDIAAWRCGRGIKKRVQVKRSLVESVPKQKNTMRQTYKSLHVMEKCEMMNALTSRSISSNSSRTNIFLRDCRLHGLH